MGGTYNKLSKTSSKPADIDRLAVLKQDLAALGAQITDPKEKQAFDKLAADCVALFNRYFELIAAGKSAHWEWEKLKEATSFIASYDKVASEKHSEADIKKYLSRVSVLKLNGGLGTSMGLSKAKSVIEVRGSLTFLDVIVNQLEDLNNKYDVDVPLILMNSEYTHIETLKVVEKYSSYRTPILCFKQSFYPRLNSVTGRIIAKTPQITEGEWYPPGHGDVYASLRNSGLLDDLIAQDRDVLFISNVDNLGATLDVSILGYFVTKQLNWISEVTQKTLADVKGGALVEYAGRPGVHLLETANVPPEHMRDFASVSTFRCFNCNNLWVRLPALRQVLQSEHGLQLDIILNPKTGPGGVPVMQLETACGAAVSHFDKSMGLEVPRSRFLPVKKCSDLLLIQSDLYNLVANSLVISPARVVFPPVRHLPAVNLDARYYKIFSDFAKRIPKSTSIVDLDTLLISGDVTLGKNVVLKGHVSIVAAEGSKLVVPDHSVLQDCIVSGSLNIATV